MSRNKISFDEFAGTKPVSPLIANRNQNHVSHMQVALYVNTLRTGNADMRFYITTVQDG